MSTQPLPVNGGSQEGGSNSAPADVSAQGRPGSTRKARQRSLFLFPAYGFNTALDIARRVEESGGGSLTEETLAINLGLSAKSSGFRLKSLAARQFQLISKQGDVLTTTPVAKAIFKPTSTEDANRGYREAFLSIPLFKAVSERYRGQRLPDSQTLRNVLEREFQVEHSRVQQAERLLLDSARETHLLRHAGDGTYLVISDNGIGALDYAVSSGSAVPDQIYPQNGIYGQTAPPHIETPPPNSTLTFTTDEIGDLTGEEFERVWNAIGILLRARRRLRTEMPPTDDHSSY